MNNTKVLKVIQPAATKHRSQVIVLPLIQKVT